MTDLIAAVVVSLLVSCSVCLDIVAMMARATGCAGNIAEHVALSGWIFYLSRLLIMIVVLGLSVLVEGSGVDAFAPQIFAVALAISVIAGLFVAYVRRCAEFFLIAIRPLVIRSFPGYQPKSYWIRLGLWPLPIDSLSIAASVSSFVLVAGAVSPFILSALFPKYRMTSVYVGQVANFAATVIVLSFQDPVFNRRLDAGDVNVSLSGVVFGKIAGVGCFAILLCIFVVIFGF